MPTSEITQVTIWYIHPPTNVTQRSGSWLSKSWVCHGQRARSCPISIWFASFMFHINQTNNSWDTGTAILRFDLEKSKVKVMGEVKGQSPIINPGSNWCTSFSFYVNRTKHSWDMSNRVCDLEKYIRFFFLIRQKKFPTEFLQNLIRW